LIFKPLKKLTEANAAYSGSSVTGPVRMESNAATVQAYTAQELSTLEGGTQIYADGGCVPFPGKAG